LRRDGPRRIEEIAGRQRTFVREQPALDRQAAAEADQAAR
jgi:hypothetical protein